ncbi:hypothetical protein TWF730_008548 [Orbilia blumenaviensis]|uniref:Elongator complex protein 2 n=1 Tax=Orbilia blumenaviensis TaxID=1796055 RepID=A0AAV9V4B1_9PEZI
MTDTRGRIHPRFISIGANRIPASSDWDTNSGFIAYGAGNVIALWRVDETDTSPSGVFATLKGHTDKVSAVRFVDDTSNSSSILLSGGVDRVLRVWKLVQPVDESGIPRYELLAQSPPHDGSIVDIAVERTGSSHGTAVSEGVGRNGKSTIIASASADGNVKIWRLDLSKEGEEVLTHLQTLDTKSRYLPLSVALARLSQTSTGSEGGPGEEVWILAVSGSSNYIQMFVGSTEETKSGFVPAATLTGHENWIRSLSFVREATTNDLLLATGSQDRYIRLWRVHRGSTLPAQSAGSKMMIMGQALSNKAHRFSAGSTQEEYSITFEALLVGHEDWVYSVSFRKDAADGKTKLLSASADNSLSIWEADETSGIWVCTARMGEASGMKGSSTATGSTGGFWAGLWSPDGNDVVSFGKNGGWRRWTNSGEGEWVQRSAVAGHIRDVMGVSWEKDGRYLLSTSLDQSTRLYARWKSSKLRSFYEFSRPQIHGYDINSIVSLSSTKFVSGADEKLMRVFGEPRGIAKMLEEMCGIQQADMNSLPDVASQPVLGLSNKAVNTTAEENGEEEDEAIEKQAYPPFEDSLSRHTLWPEEEKLYGHGYEISTIGCSNAGDVIATACKASSVSHAVVRMFETKTWRQLKPALEAHSLTVNRIAFSKDDVYMLSVGRDRQWSVFEKVTEGLEEFEAPYKAMQTMAKAHTRIIFDGKWVPLEAGRVFVTAARDKTMKSWELRGQEWECTETFKFQEPITAIDVLDQVIDLDGERFVVLAAGLENGAWGVCKAKVKENGGIEGWEGWIEVDRYIVPDRTITQIAWRPVGEEKGFEVAISSEDSSVRIYDLVI